MDNASTCVISVITASIVLGSVLMPAASRAADLKDVPYRTTEGLQLTLDAHIPDGGGSFPTAILVHGGGWVAGDKEQYITYIFKPLSDAGFAWFSINYRLAPKFRFPADAEDVESAIRWVKEHAGTYRVDPNRIVLIGESAGGHLVSYVGAKQRPGTRVAAVVSMYGVHDFITASIDWKPIPTEILQLFGIDAVDALSAPILVEASPVSYVKKDEARGSGLRSDYHRGCSPRNGSLGSTSRIPLVQKGAHRVAAKDNHPRLSLKEGRGLLRSPLLLGAIPWTIRHLEHSGIRAHRTDPCWATSAIAYRAGSACMLGENTKWSLGVDSSCHRARYRLGC